MKRGRRKLALWSALYPYLGGKRRLCPIIFREIDRVVPRRFWAGRTFLDAFSGGGAVALYAKALGLRVVAVDIAERAHLIGEGLIANSRVRLSREDILRLLAPRTGAPGPIESSYAPAVFTVEQARFLDRAFAAAAESPDPAKGALYRLLGIRVAMLAHPMSQVRAGTIERVTSGGWESISERCVRHYVDGPRLLRPERLWTLAQRINAGVFEGDGRSIKGDVLDVLPAVPADIAYFDPPYAGTRSYEAEYKTIDAILGDTARPVSSFSRKDGAGRVDELLRRATHIPVWVLSFGNAVTELQELEAKMRALGRETRATAVQYAHKESVASEEKKARSREFVVVGWNENARLLQLPLEKVVEVGDRPLEAPIRLGTAGVEFDPQPGGALGPGAQPFAYEPFDEGVPGGLHREALRPGQDTEAQPGPNEPISLLGECAVEGKGERLGRAAD